MSVVVVCVVIRNYVVAAAWGCTVVYTVQLQDKYRTVQYRTTILYSCCSNSTINFSALEVLQLEIFGDIAQYWSCTVVLVESVKCEY